jgi:hypothetical protein
MRPLRPLRLVSHASRKPHKDAEAELNLFRVSLSPLFLLRSMSAQLVASIKERGRDPDEDDDDWIYQRAREFSEENR